MVVRAAVVRLNLKSQVCDSQRVIVEQGDGGHFYHPSSCHGAFVA